MFLLEKSRELFEPFLAFFGGAGLPGGPHQIQRLPFLIVGPFVENVPYLVIPTALNRLIGTEHFIHGRPQRLRSVDHEQILAIGR